MVVIPVEMENSNSKLAKKASKKLKKDRKANKAPATALETIKKTQKSAKERKEAAAGDQRGVVLVQHLPHGFFEEEIRSFFSQFGRVYRIKLFRSKKTGVSKGYAFVEFEVEDVAKIAAEAMNNYLMFNKLIKCRLLENVKNSYQLFSNFVTAEGPREQREERRQKHYDNGPSLTKRDYMEKRLVELASVKEKLSGLGVDFTYEVIEKPFKAELERVIKKGGEDALQKIQKEPLKAKEKQSKSRIPKKFQNQVSKKAAAKAELASGGASGTVKVVSPKTPISKAERKSAAATPTTPLMTTKGKFPNGTPTSAKTQTNVPTIVKQGLVSPKNVLAKSDDVEKTPAQKSKSRKVDTPVVNTPKADTPAEKLKTPKQNTPADKLKTPKQNTPADKLKTPKQNTPAEKLKTPKQSTPADKLKTPKQNTPAEKLKTPKQDTPAEKMKTPKQSTPADKLKTPKQNTPAEKLKTPKQDTPAEKMKTPKQQNTPAEKLKTPKSTTPVEKLPTPKKTSNNAETPLTSKTTPKPGKVKTPKIETETLKETAAHSTPISAPVQPEQSQRKKKKSLPKVSPKMLRSRAKQELLSTPAVEVTTPAKTPKQKRGKVEQESTPALENNETPAKRRKSMFAGSKPADTPKAYPKFSPKMLRSRGIATPTSTASPAVKPKGRKSVI